MMTVEINGDRYTRLIDIEVGYSMTAIARDFSMTIANPSNISIPFKGGESIQVYEGSDIILDGFIDETSPSHSKRHRDILIFGRSRVADLVDSSLLPITLAADTSLPDAIKAVIRQLGLGIRVINQVPDLQPFSKSEDGIGAEPGEDAFSFIDRLARKKQVLLTSDATGNIVITRSAGSQNSGSLINRINGSDGNIESSSVSYRVNNRYNKYIVMSQQNSAAGIFGGAFNPPAVVDQRGERVDPSVRSGRQLVMMSEKASSSANATDRAVWQANIARVRSRSYSAVVKGLRNLDGRLWDINQLQYVMDEQASIDELMLVDSVRMLQDKKGGTVTQLSLVYRDAYDILLSEPKQENLFAQFN